ncbi:MAG TPA: hypothetical protein PLM80_06575 [Mesotoga sp.]|jgi:hypothetical protein|nr:hypothetical protein [Mesotoga sp.]MDI9376339.1 hypothetical protein [Thermotogota bacterium]NLX34573.1 hypothetical protein [Thermotogaceae bacterium]MDD4041762.1 hypothetical protein [Mesotoga sp.]HOI64304.1 hypothetical protein [Mesotoga sp.]
MSFALKRGGRPKINRIRNNFIRASVLLAVVTPVSIYGIFGFMNASKRLEGFGWLLPLLIVIWALVGAIWLYSFYMYRKALQNARSYYTGLRSRRLKASGSSFDRSIIVPIKMKSS